MREKELQFLFSELIYFDDMFTEIYRYACQIMFDERFIYIEREKNHIMKEYMLLEVGNTSYNDFMCQLLIDSLSLAMRYYNITFEQYFTYLGVDRRINKHMLKNDLIGCLNQLNKHVHIDNILYVIKKHGGLLNI